MLDSTSGVTSSLLRSSDVNDGTAVPAAYDNGCQCRVHYCQNPTSSARPLWAFYPPYARVCTLGGNREWGKVIERTQYFRYECRLTI